MNRTVTKTYIDPETGREVSAVLPARWIICPECNGDGYHVHYDVDGFSLDDPDVEADFLEAYFSGALDVACGRCGQRGKVLALDAEALDPAVVEAVAEADRLERWGGDSWWNSEDARRERQQMGGVG